MSNINIDCIVIALMTINCLHTFMSFVTISEGKGSGTTSLEIRG